MGLSAKGWKKIAASLLTAVLCSASLITSSTAHSDEVRKETRVEAQSDPSHKAPMKHRNIELPQGVTVVKVIKDVKLGHHLNKRVELLSDGGKRVTIGKNNGRVFVYYIEYEGVITAVNDRQVTVQLKSGQTKQITIPEQVVIEDDDQLGLRPGVKIEWEIDRNGDIISVELDD